MKKISLDLTGKFDSLAQSPGLMLLKDASSRFVSMTHDMAILLGYQSVDDCIGQTDYEIPSQASELAEEFTKIDKKVFCSAKKMTTLEFVNYGTFSKALLVRRTVVANNNTIHLFFQCIDVSDVSHFNPYFLIYQDDLKRIIGKTVPVGVYILDNLHCPYKLTEKQKICLFLLLRGKTIKEIASILKLSPRTIQEHLNTLKNKMHCQHKSELIEKAIENGFFYYIPTSL